MITYKTRGDWSRTTLFLKSLKEGKHLTRLEEYAEMGLKALQEVTPVRTGKTRASWKYEIKKDKDLVTITWINDNLDAYNNPIVLLLDKGHVTKNGHYIQGRNFIEPAIEPVFDIIAEKAWVEVTKQ